jgi:arylsulfatase A-like enzyme
MAKPFRGTYIATAQFGKCHEVPMWETSPAGPFHQWPTGSGFEYFYGFIGGEANQWYPGIFEGTSAVQPPRTPEEGYHLTEDLADRAVSWVRQQKALVPDKPFFMYFAPGATPPLTMCPRSGRPSTRASSTKAGTSCERRRSAASGGSASSPKTPG